MSKKEPRILASEAVYTFAAWLTTRRTITLAGSCYDAAPIAELVAEFCEINDLKPPREDIYPNNMKMPKDDDEGQGELEEDLDQCLPRHGNEEHF